MWDVNYTTDQCLWGCPSCSRTVHLQQFPSPPPLYCLSEKLALKTISECSFLKVRALKIVAIHHVLGEPVLIFVVITENFNCIFTLGFKLHLWPMDCCILIYKAEKSQMVSCYSLISSVLGWTAENRHLKLYVVYIRFRSRKHFLL